MTFSRTARAAALVLVLALALVAEPATAGSPDPDRFHSGRVYRGSFPDPDVFRLGRLWIATSTSIAQRSLPMLTSGNGRVWRARTAHGAGSQRTNDALLGVPAWAARERAGSRHYMATWAPTIGRAGDGRWLAAYAAPLRGHRGKRCIGIASAKRAVGPYRVHRAGTLVCPRTEGAIDPDLFSRRGRTYLLWKTEGIRGRTPTTIRVRALSRHGLRFARGSRPRTLLRTARPWEQPVIENPSMIGYRGRLYLFYSANRWYTRHYAVGYAVCRSVLGPCRRVQRGPLLASGRRIAGPGGESAFRGPHGRLLLAYAAWPGHRVGSARRLHVASLRAGHRGRLVVVRRIRGR